MAATFRVAEDVLFQVVADEAVLLHIGDNRYYGLDDVATRMWQLLAEHGELEPAITTMLAEYAIDEPTLRADFSRLIATLEQRGLLTRLANP